MGLRMNEFVELFTYTSADDERFHGRIEKKKSQNVQKKN